MTKLLEHVLVPVANEEDAAATARALAPYGPSRVTALHVVEKGEGVPDKTPVEQSEQIAEAAFEVIRETFPEAESETAYGRDVVASVLEAATDLGVTVIVFRSREGGRLARFLSGNLSERLVAESELPVLALPRAGDSEP
jgi:nucleotide-binding universal stress UspA family protein